MKIKLMELYGEEPIKPLAIKKYYIDDKIDLKTRNMTYEMQEDVMFPTFEINDIIIDKYGKGEMYVIVRIERDFNEIYAISLLDKNQATYLDTSEVVHYLKDVELIK